MELVNEAAAEGVRKLAEAHDFGRLTKLKLSPREAREHLAEAVRCAENGDRRRAEVWSALLSDAAIRNKADAVDRTPLCLLDVAQTSFLKNLTEVCSFDALPRRGDRHKHFLEAIANTLFVPWRRKTNAVVPLGPGRGQPACLSVGSTHRREARGPARGQHVGRYSAYPS